MQRPFRVPGGWLGVALVTLAPLCCAALLLIVSLRGENADPRQALVVCLAILSGIALYFGRRKTAGARLDTSTESTESNFEILV